LERAADPTAGQGDRSVGQAAIGHGGSRSEGKGGPVIRPNDDGWPHYRATAVLVAHGGPVGAGEKLYEVGAVLPGHVVETECISTTPPTGRQNNSPVLAVTIRSGKGFHYTELGGVGGREGQSCTPHRAGAVGVAYTRHVTARREVGEER